MYSLKTMFNNYFPLLPTRLRCLVLPGCLALSPFANADFTIKGNVVNVNGQPVPQVQIIYDRDEIAPGASVVTIFSAEDGSFQFPAPFSEAATEDLPISVRALGYDQIDKVSHLVLNNTDLSALELTFVVASVDNQVEVAPASAWLGRISDRAQQSKFIMDCIDCHQVPASEVRGFASSIADIHAPDQALARSQSWSYIVKYMNYLSSWEFSRAQRNANELVDADSVYSVDNGDEVATLLSEIFDDRLDFISGYDWGAPLITTAETTIWEYEVPHPNAIREALLLGNPAKLWIADVSSNSMYAIDIATGKQERHEVPTDVLMSPHSLHRGQDGSLWITPLFNSIVAHLDVNTNQWETWRLRTNDGKNPGIHDLSFGYEHELLSDQDGQIWFSDIGNNSVGYFDPEDGSSAIWPAPASPGREGRTSLYGLSMTKDRNQVWYSQLGNGSFGGFDIARKEYIGPFQLPDINSGPRRISISDDDIVYLALYGSGQLAEFDTKTQTMIGIYDLPDTASAPYSTTWDTVRNVVWIATSNGDVIYRFDPSTKEFGILPLPREQAFLRGIDIDKDTGVLVSSYANIVDIVQGPRMAVIIDPGDNAYPQKFSPNSYSATIVESNVESNQ